MDCYGAPATIEQHAADILARNPDVVGFSCTTSSFLEGYAIAERVKEQRPDIRIVFGGAHACTVGASLLDSFPAIDYLVIGEGEVTFAELMSSGLPERWQADPRHRLSPGRQGHPLSRAGELSRTWIDSPFPPTTCCPIFPGATTCRSSATRRRPTPASSPAAAAPTSAPTATARSSARLPLQLSRIHRRASPLCCTGTSASATSSSTMTCSPLTVHAWNGSAN